MIITLTTDFGLSDPFVGILKGVILSIAPAARIVDITHDLRSYDIAEAAFVINSAFSYFPEKSIHVVVVDPGVGSDRRPIAAFSQGHYFVAPDNGVLSFVLHAESKTEIPAVYRISNDNLFIRGPIGRTFHGRDIFAPVAAHIAAGTPLESVGDRVADFSKQALPKAGAGDNGCLRATVMRVDKFGNLITDLRRGDLKAGFSIRLAGREVTRLCGSFSEGGPGELFAIEGSTGYIEIAINQDSAADRLIVARGAEIEVETGLSNL